jgi:hypothetical protein
LWDSTLKKTEPNGGGRLRVALFAQNGWTTKKRQQTKKRHALNGSDFLAKKKTLRQYIYTRPLRPWGPQWPQPFAPSSAIQGIKQTSVRKKMSLVPVGLEGG